MPRKKKETVRENDNPVIVAYIKLKTGENIVAMIEESKKIAGEYVLYNPYRITPLRQLGAPADKTIYDLEEWLPEMLTKEPMCVIHGEDIITFVEANPEFTTNYQRLVLRKFGVRHILSQLQMPSEPRNDSFEDRVNESMNMAEEESEEDVKEKIEDKLVEWRKKFN